MRAAPALQLTLEHFRAWRLVLALLRGAAAGAVAAWIALRFDVLTAPGWAVAAAALVAAWSGAATCLAPRRLSWDGERWRVGLAAADFDEAPAGTLRVMLDLGIFLLLRFEPDDNAHAVEWLPAQRRGHEASWHALRCAVYSSRPAAASAPPDDPPPPA